ncbi:ACT domain-containing protein ACR9-like [Wolffia australiana]
MGVGNEDGVVIRAAEKAGEAAKITVNCPDKTGLGCDFCWIIFDFGLRISKADVSTDGRWCFCVFWVLPCWTNGKKVQWGRLKSRLLSACPSLPIPFFHDPSSLPTNAQLFLLKILCLDRKGLLHEVTQVLSELELRIQRVKVSTTPDGGVVDLFFISDSRELLHTQKRKEETCERLNSVLGDTCAPCEIESPGVEYELPRNGFTSLPTAVAEELFRSEPSHDRGSVKETTSVSVDNSLSPAHTILHIRCVDQKGLLYDVLRTLKDCNIQIAYDRFLTNKEGFREIDLFVQRSDGKKIEDPEEQRLLCCRIIAEIRHPLRVTIASRGPDSELIIANPVELSGKGRPRVFYDVTVALKLLGICIFSAEIGRQSAMGKQWEVYRFLLDEGGAASLLTDRGRRRVVDVVRNVLMGWAY